MQDSIRFITAFASLARLAEQYLETDANSKTAVKKPEKEGFSSSSAFSHKKPETQSFRRTSPSKKTCFTCGKLGHISKDCFHNKKKLAGMERYSSRGGYSKPLFGRGYNPQASHPMPGSSSHEIEAISQTSQNQKMRCKRHRRVVNVLTFLHNVMQHYTCVEPKSCLIVDAEFQ